MRDTISIDLTIIGGGIVGLTLAYTLKDKFPDCEIALFDKELYPGEHSSGRNSGVLHAGLYYPNQSLKHLLCLEGNHLWDQLASDLSIGIRRCGKFIFSTSKNEESDLEDLFNRAKKNNVQIEWATEKQIFELRKNVNAENAIYSPFTGILDVSDALYKLKYNLESRNVHVFFSSEIQSIETHDNGYKLKLNDFDLKTSHVFNCAGLGAVSIREKLGLTDIENYLVKGNYLSTTQQLNYETLYYPIPPKDLKGLGVHSTIDLQGKIKFGPNTEEIETVDYRPPQASLVEMKEQVTACFKDVDSGKLYWDYAGIRSKIRNKLTRQIYTDFKIDSPLKNYIECLGIESPGVTASPAIAKRIAALLH